MEKEKDQEENLAEKIEATQAILRNGEAIFNKSSLLTRTWRLGKCRDGETIRAFIRGTHGRIRGQAYDQIGN